MAIKRKPLDYESAEHLCNNLIKNKKKKIIFEKLHRKVLLIIRHSGMQSNHF